MIDTAELRKLAEAATPDMRDTDLVVARLRKRAPRDVIDSDGLLIRAADLLTAKDAEIAALKEKVKRQAEAPQIGDKVRVTSIAFGDEWRGQSPEIVGIDKSKDGTLTYTFKDDGGCLSDMWQAEDFELLRRAAQEASE